MNWPGDALRRILGTDTEPPGDDDSVDFDPSNVSGSDIAAEFENCRHRERLGYVIRPPDVPYEAWDMFTEYVEAREQRRENWGIWQSVVDTDSQPPTCGDHGDEVATKISLGGSETTTKSETEESTTTATVSGSLGTSGTKVSGETSAAERTAETTTDKQQQQFTRSVYECGTDDPDCRLNRRAFWQIGNDTFSTGSAASERRTEQFQAFLEDISDEDSSGAADSDDETASSHLSNDK